MPEVPISTRKTYDLFLSDVRARDLNVLPDEEIRDRIRIIRGAASSEEEKAVARNQIVDSSLRMIPYAIKNTRKLGIPQEELVGEAFQVINSCIDRFDPEHISSRTEDEVKWSSYVFTSLEFMLRSPKSVVRVGEVFRIPQHAQQFIPAMRKARELFLQEESREPNQDEWYKRTLRFIDENRSSRALIPEPEQFKNIKNSRFTGVARVGKKAYRGNVDIDTESPLVGSVEETIADPDVDTFEEASDFFLSQNVQRLLGVLKPRERRIVELRYGLGVNEDGKRPDAMPLEAVGKVFDLTKSRIRVIEKDAFRKLRHAAVRRKMHEYIIPPSEQSKRDEIEERYKTDVSRIADRMLVKLTPQSTIALLENLRKGSVKNGRLDPELLGRILDPEEIAKLIESEEQYFRFKPPRVITQDIVAAMNRALRLFRFRQGFANSPWASITEVQLKEKE